MYNHSFYGEKFFDDSKSSEIVNFKYKGTDASLLYKYFFSPVSEFFVDHCTPTWVAFT